MQKIRVYNPLAEDFTCSWLDGENKAHELKCPSLEISTFDEPQGEFMIKHLADYIADQRGRKPNIYQQLDDIRQEITIYDL